MKKALLRIWGDVVETKALVFSIVIITGFTMGAHLLAPKDNDTLGLFLGIAGAITGFVLCALIFSPQRIIHEQERD
ncbi:MAG: hypothetical protein ACQEQA_02495 [Bacillota bacterium]